MSYSLHKNIIVATDLDGTLLDHYSYSWQAATESLDYLASRNIPIVINTSKTFSEVQELQKNLGIDAGFIVENGSAVYMPNNSDFAEQFDAYDEQFSREVFGVDRSFVIETLRKLRAENTYHFEAYADWEIEDVVQHTGLKPEDAARSLDRQFSEPLIWKDTEEAYKQFCNDIKNHKLRIIRGGRFIHILGQSDKGSSLISLKERLYPDQTCSLICLGDSYNDLDMLNIADIPVFVRSPTHDFPQHHCTHPPIFTEGLGPIGWHEAITKIFLN